jgi:hypothetical protein
MIVSVHFSGKIILQNFNVALSLYKACSETLLGLAIGENSDVQTCRFPK